MWSCNRRCCPTMRTTRLSGKILRDELSSLMTLLARTTPSRRRLVYTVPTCGDPQLWNQFKKYSKLTLNTVQLISLAKDRWWNVYLVTYVIVCFLHLSNLCRTLCQFPIKCLFFINFDTTNTIKFNNNHFKKFSC